jgi:excisionase family DNA binding protein
MGNSNETPFLIPYEPAEFWEEIRKIVREEVKQGREKRKSAEPVDLTPPKGLTEKPLYKINEICALFNISRTTVHEWVKDGRLRKIKIKSRVFFLNTDIRKIIE